MHNVQAGLRSSLAALLLGSGCAVALNAEELILVEDGKSVPIVVFENAPPFTRQAADELADYIEKTSGAKPEVIEGVPASLPVHAIWVGYQPVLKKLFPKLDFTFKHPEEILIAANEDHLVIAGRDVWDPAHLVVEGRRQTIEGKQQEYGTCNAVYTFLQDYLGVRWLWPGELGEDVVERETIALAPFIYRYHPQVRSRSGLFNYSRLGQGGRSASWSRRQRIQLDSFEIPAGHAFPGWWDRFHEEHPGYFALQPDGTRCGWPGPRTAKLCQSNPEVWDQWLACVEEQLEADPNRKVFSISPNDGSCNGICVCTNCRAWDCLEADICRYNWQTMGQEYLVMSDRYQTFARHLGQKLKARYPDKDYQMLLHAYGDSSKSAPVKATPVDSLIISYVGNFPWGTEDRRQADKERIRQWMTKGASKMIYRPNVSRQPGLPEVFLKRTIEDVRFLAEQNYIGIFIDMIWEHWATCGPQYYLMAQLVWDPSQDGWAVLDDYYQRGFGPAAAEIKAYWTLFDEARDAYIRREDKVPYESPYAMDVVDRAEALLDQAAAKVADREPYEDRVGFLRVGLDFARLMVANYELMQRVRGSGGADTSAADAVRANWEKIDRLTSNRDARYPLALNQQFLRAGHGRYTSGLHPDFPYGVVPRTPEEGAGAKSVSLIPAEEGGWDLVFRDDFNRDDLGEDWSVINGQWEVRDGVLRGSGILACAAPLLKEGAPSFQRLEFDVVTDVEQALFLPGRDLKLDLCDMTAFIHAASPGDDWKDVLFSGYLFQFGGMHNTLNRIMKGNADCIRDEDPATVIEAGKRYNIVVENDGGHVKQFVNGELLQDYEDKAPMMARPGQGSIGLYFYTACKVFDVRVYAKE